MPVLGEAGLLGTHLQGCGCAGAGAVEHGIAMQELEAGDSGLRTFVSVPGSLAMSAIAKHGSEEQRAAWLVRMARGEAIGCVGLTEPDAGSDPGAMRTFASSPIATAASASASAARSPTIGSAQRRTSHTWCSRSCSA